MSGNLLMAAVMLAVSLVGCSRVEEPSASGRDKAQPNQAVAKNQSGQADKSKVIYRSKSVPVYEEGQIVGYEQTHEYGDYRIFVLSYSHGNNEFQIQRNGKIIHSQKEDNGIFYGGADADERFGTKFLAVPVISDINKNGIPDLVVRRVSSGNHCCCIYHISSWAKG